MSYLIGKLLRLQQEQAAFEQLVRDAPVMGLPRADSRIVGLLLPTTSDDDLRALIERALEPANRELPTASTLSLVATLRVEPLASDALSDYPLNSPRMLQAAKAHGIDERILSEVATELNMDRGEPK